MSGYNVCIRQRSGYWGETGHVPLGKHRPLHGKIFQNALWQSMKNVAFCFIWNSQAFWAQFHLVSAKTTSQDKNVMAFGLCRWFRGWARGPDCSGLTAPSPPYKPYGLGQVAHPLVPQSPHL